MEQPKPSRKAAPARLAMQLPCRQPGWCLVPSAILVFHAQFKKSAGSLPVLLSWSANGNAALQPRGRSSEAGHAVSAPPSDLAPRSNGHPGFRARSKKKKELTQPPSRGFGVLGSTVEMTG
tara:strand:- start:1903 stop:2265 length:363 start_codon:yes stop_codon:yes gene_type:complete